MQDSVVFVIDDDSSVRKALTRLITASGYPVEAFSSAVEFMNRSHFDGSGCVLLDIHMPGLNGLQLQEEMILAGYNIPIIFISGYGTIPMSVKAMKAGAIDFLPKPFKEDELLSAIKKAIEKDTKRQTELSLTQQIRNRLNILTPREYDVLCLVVQGLLNKQIGAELGISEKTVKVHRSRVMDKMQAGSLAELVLSSQKVGLSSQDATFINSYSNTSAKEH